MHESLTQWLAQAAAARGLEIAAMAPMRVEASTRAFHRVTLRDREPPFSTHTEVAMTSPPATERNDRFLVMQEVFTNAGLPVPRILASSPDHGFFLLTDLGTRHLEEAYRDGESDAALAVAVDYLLRLQRVADPRLTPYPEARLRSELGIFTEWFVTGLLGAPLPDDTGAAFDILVANDLAQPQCCIHLDYHCRNLLLSEGGVFGIVDFQDAMVGPASYDLASLLYDCYHRFDAATIARWRDAYLERTPIAFERASFVRVFELTALQRQLKAIGIFARLHLRDGKPSHLPHILPVLEVARENAARYGETSALARWLDELHLAARGLLA